jgi:WD40 repeat protein
LRWRLARVALLGSPDSALCDSAALSREGRTEAPALSEAISEASAFVLLVTDSGIGRWQEIEYEAAFDKHVNSPDFPVVLMLLEGQAAPRLSFLKQLHWIVTPDPTSEKNVARLIEAVASGHNAKSAERWRYTSPYRGLSAMEEKDSDYFFGRERETVEVLRVLAAESARLPVLFGNSGVGKSSLAQAGVIAALRRQDWPEQAGAGIWPAAFQHSRGWCFLTLKPGTEPIKALVEPFLRTWQYDATDPEWEERQKGWVDRLVDGRATLHGLLDATERRYEELGQPKPLAFFLYIDQGEELYVRAESEERQRLRFSQLLAQAVADPRLVALMSMRSDFLGALQNDEPLFAVHRKIDVPPLREAELVRVIREPAQQLSARFESDQLIDVITRRTLEDSAKDVGALPLMSYTLDDMWTEMVRRGDGVLRLPAAAFELSGVLAVRASSFLARNPSAEDMLRRVLTLKLATVREQGEPTRRRAVRSEFTGEEWRLVSELADDPNRLLVTATPEGSEIYAEVAHEAIFRRWQKLRDWIATEREFLVWKNGLEDDRRKWEQTPADSKNEALLMGLGLVQAQTWLFTRGEDLARGDREFIDLSLKRERLEQEQRGRLRRRLSQIAVATLVLIGSFAAFSAYQWSRVRAERDIGRITQARLLASAATQLADAGDATSAMLLALAALPDKRGGAELPRTFEAERALLGASQIRREIGVLAGHAAPIRIAAVSPDGLHIVTASDDGTARIWDSKSGKEVFTFSGHEGAVLCATFSPDGRQVVTASVDMTARIWNVDTGKEIAILKGHEGEVNCASFSPDRRRVVTASDDKTARIWDAQTGAELSILRGHTAEILSAKYSPDGRHIVTGSMDTTALLWDAENGRQISVLASFSWVMSGATYDGRVTDIAFSPDGRRVVIASNGWKAQILDTVTGNHIAELSHGGPVTRASFSRDGRQVLTASRDRTARLWDANSGKELLVLRGHKSAVLDAAFSPNGKYVVSASSDRTARIWDADSGIGLAVLAGHVGEVVAASFSADGGRIVTASEDKTARLWSIEATNEAIILNPSTSPRYPLYDASFSPDGQLVLVSSYRDASWTAIWDLAVGRTTIVFDNRGAGGRSTFGPDGRRVVTGGGQYLGCPDRRQGRCQGTCGLAPVS